MRFCFLSNPITQSGSESHMCVCVCARVTQGEYIHDGSVREVKEETGVSLSSCITFTCYIRLKANPILLWIICF